MAKFIAYITSGMVYSRISLTQKDSTINARDGWTDEYVDNTLTFSSRLFRSGNWNRNIRIRLVNNVVAVWKMINVSSSEILV